MRRKLEDYKAKGDKLIPPIRILRDFGWEIKSAAKLNRFIIENWPDVFPTFETRVRIPAERTGEFLDMLRSDPSFFLPFESLEFREWYERATNPIYEKPPRAI